LTGCVGNAPETSGLTSRAITSMEHAGIAPLAKRSIRKMAGASSVQMANGAPRVQLVEHAIMAALVAGVRTLHAHRRIQTNGSTEATTQTENSRHAVQICGSTTGPIQMACAVFALEVS